MLQLILETWYANDAIVYVIYLFLGKKNIKNMQCKKNICAKFMIKN